MEENVYKEACNVYSTCSDDASNVYEEPCTLSPPTVSAVRRAPGLNPAPGASVVSGETGSSGPKSNDKRQAADPGPASAEIAGYIPGVGMRSPGTGQSRVWTSATSKTYAVVTTVLICCLLGVTIFLVVTVSNLKLSFNKLDKKTTDDLSDLKMSVSKLDKKTAGIQANVSGWMLHQQKTFSESAETCRADGGTLAMPRDEGINDFLVSLDEIGRRWFGLHRQEDKWEWIDGTALGTGYSDRIDDPS
ncbi:PREDICTED: uncharacterized protein LOC109484362 [Branchiostoma belcheri]|uniref:Uncharacterized protein LOC109484362 n=1 Tax=Branchiostoma belcheri TaxID=7741 RepID=A0A6P5A1J4_BRABE|nr:PREDICTED: uncharacterized protein LOC109484362 [Branchiostoma belcheri]